MPRGKNISYDFGETNPAHQSGKGYKTISKQPGVQCSADKDYSQVENI